MTVNEQILELVVSPRIKFKGEGTASIESLNYDGRGVAHVDGKATFIENAVPGETVEYGITRQKSTYDNGVAKRVLKRATDREEKPRCEYFGICGGCAIQHIRSEAQIGYKQQIVLEQMQHIAGALPQAWLPPLVGPYWGYRRKARLGARKVEKKGGVLVGFREKSSAYIADMHSCAILDQRVSKVIPQLRELIAALTIPNQIPQIEIAAGDNEVALVFRHLAPMQNSDVDSLRQFGTQHGFQIWLQPEGPDTIFCITADVAPALRYRFDRFPVSIEFAPLDFTQVNAEVNQRMVEQAIELLQLTAETTVVDLFCGLGNFSLPMASRAKSVIGVEGNQRLVDGASGNARLNGIDNAKFVLADLFDETGPLPWGDTSFDRLLLDPPRSGAIEILKRLPDPGPERIVYVSCYPATLARDAAYLVNTAGYRLVSMGVMDMFPQTTHVETMALFEKVPG